MIETASSRAVARFPEAPRFMEMLDALGIEHEVQAGAVVFREASTRGELGGRLDPLLRRDQARGRTVLNGLRMHMDVPLANAGRLVLAERRLCSRFTRWLNRYGRLHPIPLPPSLDHLEAWAHDPPWATHLLADVELIAQVGDLLAAEDAPRHVVLHWYPDRLTLVAQDPQRSILQRFRAWRLRLLALAARTRDLPAPTSAHRPRWIETRPTRVAVVLVCVLLLAGLLFTGLLIGLSFLLTWRGS